KGWIHRIDDEKVQYSPEDRPLGRSPAILRRDFPIRRRRCRHARKLAATSAPAPSVRLELDREPLARRTDQAWSHLPSSELSSETPLVAWLLHTEASFDRAN